MPSIMTLEGPSLHGRSLVSGTFRPQILSTAPALGFASFTASAANFWLGAGLGVIGTIAAQRVMSGKPLWNKKSSNDVGGARAGRRGRRTRRSRR